MKPYVLLDVRFFAPYPAKVGRTPWSAAGPPPFPAGDDSFVGQAANLQPIGNRPAGSAYGSGGMPATFAAYSGSDSLSIRLSL